jgi:hypothetical protein
MNNSIKIFSHLWISLELEINALDKQILEQLIERIEIYETNENGKREKIIKIIYRFIGSLSEEWRWKDHSHRCR